jgi:hypothetical protein
MKRFSAGWFAVALAVPLFTASARADFIAWTYNWTPSAPTITADSPGTGGINMTNEPTKGASDTSDTVATNLRTFSSASAATPDKFTDKAYSLTLFLQDDASGASGTMVFHGAFSGTLSATNAKITNTFTGDLTQELTLGDNKYTVTIGPFTPPGPPNASNSGSIAARVVVEPREVNTIPEPSSLVLSFVGLSFCGFACWRKWNRGKKG